MSVISQKHVNKKLHPLIVEQVKWFLLGNREIDLDTFINLDCQIRVLGNRRNCHSCQVLLKPDWKMCNYCSNIVCKNCYTCKHCDYKLMTNY